MGAIAKRYDPDIGELFKEAVNQPEATGGFVPAKTIEEAREFAKAHIAEKVDIPKSFRDLDTFNKVNQAVYENMQKFDVPKFKTMETSSVDGQAAFVRTYLPDRVFDFGFNPEMLSDTDALYKKNVTDAIKHCGMRWAVLSEENTLQSVIDHEFGHVIMNRNPSAEDIVTPVFKKYNRVRGVMISRYAKKNEREFFAEAFSMYQQGATLPEDIVAMIMEVMK
jgi:hypothetical protein